MANELLHLLRCDSHAGPPLHAPSQAGHGPRQRMGMRLAWLPTPIIGRGRSLHVSRRSRHRDDRARTIGCRGRRLFGEDHQRSGFGSSDHYHFRGMGGVTLEFVLQARGLRQPFLSFDDGQRDRRDLASEDTRAYTAVLPAASGATSTKLEPLGVRAGDRVPEGLRWPSVPSLGRRPPVFGHTLRAINGRGVPSRAHGPAPPRT